MLTLKNKLTLLLGFGVLIALFAVGTFSDTAKAAGETYSWLGSGNINASGGYYTAPASIILDTQSNKWVLKTGTQLNFNGSKCTAGAEFNAVFNVDKSKNTIAYSGNTIGNSPASACPSISKLGTNTVTISGGAPTTPTPSTPTSCNSYIDPNQNTVCRIGMSYYGNSVSDTTAAEASCDKAQYNTDANSNKIQLIAICKQGVVFAYQANMVTNFASIRTLACDGETGGVAASCMSSFDTNLTKCTNSSRGDFKALQACLVVAYPSLADQINALTLNGTAATGTSNCTVDGIGWIVCPVMNLMSHVVDAAYGFVASLLTVQPLMTTDSGIYTAWSAMRTFANVAFVIAFIIIIYSQLTGAGINNYGIKKMLPRLIVAAILVNVSYWICAIAVDLSNIIGTSVSGLFGGLELKSPGFNDIKTGAGILGWVGITGVVLATAGVALYVGLAALLPAVIAAVLAIVTVFLVLTLRQALIILLVIISPLAFVAYLLPNTESLFKKWRELFQTLLLMFPIIALIFGASALASGIVMSGASGPYKIAIQIMGALIAIIPLAITPLVMKTAGSLLGKFGGAINNPNKGPFDRMRKGAQGLQERSKVSRGLRAMDPNKQSMPGRRGFINFANKRHAIGAGRKEQFEEMQKEQIAEMATAENGKFAQKVAGNKAELYQAKQASYLASIDPVKLKLEVDQSQIKNMVTQLTLGVKDSANTIGEIQAVFNQASKDNSAAGIIKARAAQEILMNNTGNKGKAALRESLRSVDSKSAVGTQLRKDISNSGMKSNAADIYTWSVDQQHRSLDAVAQDESTWNGLGDAQVAGQIKDSLVAAIKTGGISPDMAASALASRGSENIGAPEKAVLREYAQNIATQSAPPQSQSAQPAISLNTPPQHQSPASARTNMPANTSNFQATPSGLIVPQSVINNVTVNAPPAAPTTLTVNHNSPPSAPEPPVSFSDNQGRTTPGSINPEQATDYHDRMGR